MKNTIKYFIAILALGFISACGNESENPWTGDAQSGGLIVPINASNNYVVGNNATYTMNFEVKQGAVMPTTVDVVKSFYSVKDAAWSNEVVFTSFTIASTVDHVVSFDINYAQLIEGLDLNQQPLPASDGDLTIGDYWSFKLVSNFSSGNPVVSQGKTKLAVSTRFAGVYTVVASSYIHPTAGDQGGWNGQLRVIESVDAITYLATDIGPWIGEPTNFYYFTVEADDSIIIPKEYPASSGLTGNQLIWGADEIALCTLGETPDQPCDMKVTRDDVNGKDQLELTYGYIRSSGTRQFTETIVKQ
jgi:hypothetical protein